MRTLTIAITSYMHIHDYNIQANTLHSRFMGGATYIDILSCESA